MKDACQSQMQLKINEQIGQFSISQQYDYQALKYTKHRTKKTGSIT